MARITYKNKTDEQLEALADVASINRQLAKTPNGYATTESDRCAGIQRRAEAELASRRQ